jgi:hypothetical protein
VQKTAQGRMREKKREKEKVTKAERKVYHQRNTSLFKLGFLIGSNIGAFYC